LSEVRFILLTAFLTVEDGLTAKRSDF